MIDFTGQTYTNILAAMLARVPNTFDKRDGSFIHVTGGNSFYEYGILIQNNICENQHGNGIYCDNMSYSLVSGNLLSPGYQPISGSYKFSLLSRDTSAYPLILKGTENTNNFVTNNLYLGKDMRSEGGSNNTIQYNIIKT